MRLSFSIKSSTHYLAFLRKLVSVLGKLGGDGGFDHEASVSCALALVEAVNNAIFHAHKGDEERWIGVEMELKNGAVEMKVFDNGEGFEMPDVDMPKLDDTHGRGLFIIKSVMDEVRYSKGSRNMLRMVYRR